MHVYPDNFTFCMNRQTLTSPKKPPFSDRQINDFITFYFTMTADGASLSALRAGVPVTSRNRLKSIQITFCLVKQLIPIIRWMTTIEHFFKNSIGIRFTAISSFVFLVVYPGKNDGF